MAEEFVELSGRVSYGADITDFIRRGATYVDKILGRRIGQFRLQEQADLALCGAFRSARLTQINATSLLDSELTIGWTTEVWHDRYSVALHDQDDHHTGNHPYSRRRPVFSRRDGPVASGCRLSGRGS